VNVLTLFSVDAGHDNLAEKPQGDEPLLGIGDSIVLVRVGHAFEHLLDVEEIEPVLLEVPSPLWFIPRDHLSSVYTERVCVKGWRLAGLTSVFRRAPLLARRL